MVDHGMMKAYSEDLRKKVVEAVEQRGTSKSEAARLFSISLSSVKRFTRLASRGEPLTPRKGGGRPPKADELTRKLLEEDIRTRPAATVEERRRLEGDGSPIARCPLSGFCGRDGNEHLAFSSVWVV